MTGSHLSHYRITGELGRGGMGIVYEAEDTKLDRTVAIKILPSSALTSEDDRARFYREAKAAAALNHPNIAQIYEIDEAVPIDDDGQPISGPDEKRPFIAMEHIDGSTLEERIHSGPLKLTEAVRIGRNIAEALKAAHEKNIIHRDIKSANIMLTSEGQAKVLDFGLAKTVHSTLLTRMGSTLGTIAYMSPEQAKGEPADMRSDLYALGTVLYEMVAGRRPFQGEYEQAVVYGILNEQPDPLTALRTGVPMQLEWIVNKLLAKDPNGRYQSAADVIVDLRALDMGGSLGSRPAVPLASTAAGAPAQQAQAPLQAAAAPARRRLPGWWLAPLALVLLAAGAAAGYVFRTPPETPPAPVQQFELTLEGFTTISAPEIAPDGSFMVFYAEDSTGTGAFRHDFESGDTRRIVDGRGDRYLISPDGERIVFRDARHVWIASATGGSPTQVSPFGSGWPGFLNDGSVMFDRDERLWIYPADGSELRPVSRVDSANGEGGHYVPWPLPGDRYVLFHTTRTDGGVRRLAVLDLKTGEHRTLGDGAAPRYIKSGHVLYFDGSSSATGRQYLRPLDASTAEWTGPAVTLTESAHVLDMTVDEFGTLYRNRTSLMGAVQSAGTRAYLMDLRTRDEQPEIVFDGQVTEFRLSPGDSLLSYSYAGQTGQLALLDLDTRVEQRLGLNSDSEFSAWSSDGQFLYVEHSNDAVRTWSLDTFQQVDTSDVSIVVSDFDVAPDGRYIAYVESDADDTGNLRLFDTQTGDDTLIVNGDVSAPRFSPDGGNISFATFDADGVGAIQVFSIELNRTLLVSGEYAHSSTADWGPDGALYMSVDRTRLVRLPVTLEPSFRVAGRTEEVQNVGLDFDFDIGTNSVVISLLDSAAGDSLHAGSVPSVTFDVITNWDRVANQLAPSAR